MDKKEDDFCKNILGKGIMILSWIPVFNWIALIILGKRCRHKVSFMCGIIYGIVTFVWPQQAAYIWMIGIIQYVITCKYLKKNNEMSVSAQPIQRDRIQETVGDKKEDKITENRKGNQNIDGIFSEIIIEGDEEKVQIIPPKNVCATNDEKIKENKHSEENLLFTNNQPAKEYESNEPVFTENKFFKDMMKYEEKTGRKTEFVPFMTYWPTYDSMTQQQKDWYFYWRTEVRNGDYPDTDLSYIFVHIYELLSGVGWRDAEEGYEQLINLWIYYHERFPKLKYYLIPWMFDFCELHQLEYKEIGASDTQLRYQRNIANCLIEKHCTDRPLKLPFSYIVELCDYDINRSKFYKEDHQELLETAIPRVVALIDASWIKKQNKGILSLYGPKTSKTQRYQIFQGANCLRRNEYLEITVKDYIGASELRRYMTNLVKFSENVLRDIWGHKGRLRNINVEGETATLIEKKKLFISFYRGISAAGIVDPARTEAEIIRLSVSK